jgi:YD repeat-containing protein
LTQVANSLGWNLSLAYENSRLSSVTGAGRTVEYHYDAQGRLTGVEDTKNQTTAQTYDTGNRLVSVRIRGHGLCVQSDQRAFGIGQSRSFGPGPGEFTGHGQRRSEMPSAA